MFDPVAMTLDALARQSPYAPLAALAAGVATSIGPCNAPRLIAAAGIATGKPATRWVHAAALAAGLMSAYALFGVAASVFSAAVQYSRAIFIGLAVMLALCGARALADDRGGRCCERTVGRPASAGASFLLGSSFAFVVSPCCTPLVAALAAYSSAGGNAAFAASCLAAFALGHAVPLLTVAAGNPVSEWFIRLRLNEGIPIVNASMMFALATYYGLLA